MGLEDKNPAFMGKCCFCGRDTLVVRVYFQLSRVEVVLCHECIWAAAFAPELLKSREEVTVQ